MRPFRCPIIILNTIDHLGKFNGKADEGFFVGYSLNSKAFRVFNSRTRIVEENLNIKFSESTPNVVCSGPDWLFDIDALTRTMNYEPIVAGAQSNGFACTKESDNARQARKETEPVEDYILLPLWTTDLPYSQDPKSSHDDGSKPSSDDGIRTVTEDPENDEDDGAEGDINNLDTTIQVSPIPTTRIHKDHPLDQEELKKVIHALKDPSWIEAMNKNDERGIVIRNKARLVSHGYTQEAGIDYDEVFALDLKIQTFLIEYTRLNKHCMDYIKLLELVYVDDIIFGSTKKELCNAFEKLMHEKFRMSSIGKLTFFLGLQVQQKKDGIFISQDIYVVGILKKFGFIEVKTTSTPMETQKPLLKDKDGEEVDVYMYRSMIGSLMYLTSSRPDIMFAVCAYVRYQVNLKVSHLHAMKRIFSDYAGGASLDTEVIQQEVVYILGCRNISSLVQNKRTVVCENTIGNAEYVAALVVVGKCFCDQNQLLDYGTIYAYQDLYWFNNRKAKKSVRLMMETLFGMELELILVTQS
ncbi:retrovirus-related pol polyprotein from transposon TNT 1-94 [Tanacetum coccineum]